MKVDIYSYSIKYRQTLPIDKPNFIFDCRAVKNPGRVEHLKILTGLDQDVIAFLAADPSAQAFMQGLQHVLLDTLPTFIEKQYSNTMSIGFCCTGGRHRSVYFSQAVAQHLRTIPQIEVAVTHLDIKSNYS